MEKLEHAQMIIKSDDLIQLKDVTGDNSTTGALSIAVEHTIKTYQKVK